MYRICETKKVYYVVVPINVTLLVDQRSSVPLLNKGAIVEEGEARSLIFTQPKESVTKALFWNAYNIGQ